jgi:hypothetical protein
LSPLVVVELEQAAAETAATLANMMAARVSGRVEGMGRAGTSMGTSPPQKGHADEPTLT